MKQSKEREAEARKVYELYWESYLSGDEKTFAATLDDAFEMIGTSESEIAHGKAAGLDFVRTQVEEIGGKAELRNRKIKAVPVEGLILFNELADIYLLVGDDWNFYSGIRLSTFMRETEAGWKVVQQHGSFPDTRVQEGETIAFEKISKENLELREAVKRRTVELENKNRELEIETSLERVRAVALGMKKPDDMLEVCLTISQESEKLGIKDIRNVQTAIFYEDKGTYINYEYYAKHDKLLTTEVDFKNHELQSSFANKMLQGAEELFQENLKGKEVQDWYEYQKTTNQYVDSFLKNAQSLNYYFYSMGPVALGISTYTPLSEEEINLFKRFRNVFDLAYRRFLDIQKAEAQAREAQIEAALERVRSKTMAMRSSRDVGDTVAVMFDELVKLGIETVRCGIGILFESMQMEAWTAKSSGEGKATLIIGRLGLNIHPLLHEVYHSWINGDQSYSYELKGEDLKDYFRAINNSKDYPIQYDIESLPSGQFQNAFFFEEGALFAFTEQPMQLETSQIFKRFSGVFGQTYTRFLDLQKAEAQAREAIKRSSLDRVRGQIASMRTARDLEHITPIIWNELKALDVPFIRCGVFFVDKEQSKVQVYLTTPDVKPLGVLSLPIETGTITAKAVDHWRNGLVFTAHWNKEQFIRWTESMLELGQIQNKETYQGSENPPEALDLYFVPFTQGMLYVGNTSPLSEELIQLIKSLADAFSIAYARYEDFNKLEKVKESIEATLTELKSTQAQLIHAEKMASLGELTAGIAHEIQNPLNFVNNFSEVSKELIGEMNEELAKGTEASIQFAKEIAEDIALNLEKINHHGKRADAIVKGMLHHSRSSSGVKEPTDINALFDEFLRLAFHGLRAKDSSFNAIMKTSFDEKIGNINIIPQDIGRVLLNLITYAFYAVTEKQKTLSGSEAYEPTVTVTTEAVIPSPADGGQKWVKISVKDNGSGIPANVMDKIFQPFFTTKPTGQGTGLGLSLSYDIVKAHGGEIQVNSAEGEGTTFILSLPF